jgi:hypothetical protein
MAPVRVPGAAREVAAGHVYLETGAGTEGVVDIAQVDGQAIDVLRPQRCAWVCSRMARHKPRAQRGTSALAPTRSSPRSYQTGPGYPWRRCTLPWVTVPARWAQHLLAQQQRPACCLRSRKRPSTPLRHYTRRRRKRRGPLYCRRRLISAENRIINAMTAMPWKISSITLYPLRDTVDSTDRDRCGYWGLDWNSLRPYGILSISTTR